MQMWIFPHVSSKVNQSFRHLRRVNNCAGFTEKSFRVVLGSQCRICRSLENCVVSFVSLSFPIEAPVKKHFSFSELVMPPVFMRHAWVRVKSLQTSLTLCDPMDHQAPLSMGFSRHEYWSGLSYPPPGDLPNQGSNPSLFCLLTAGRFFTTSATWEAHYIHYSSVTTTLSNQL